MDGGREATVDELLDTIRYNDFNVTLSGKQELGKTVWCFTGFTWDEIQADPALQLPLQWIDVVVEGRFIEALRDTQLRFRGSPNQRIVDVAASKGKAIPVELTEYY